MKAQSRRVFLSQTALAAMGLLFLSHCKKKSTDTSPKQDILVIGAGIAGLAAAKTLMNAGHNVSVLEADNRFGGRIKTVEMGNYSADFGASWIHGINGNPLYKLAGENALITKPTFYNPSYIFDIDGQEITSGEWKIIEKKLEDLYKLAYDNFGSSLQDLLHLMEPDLNLSDKLRRVFFGGVRSEIEIPYAVDAKDIAAKALTTNDSFPGKDVVFQKGMGGLTTALAQGLNIRYNSFVTKVAYAGDKVNVYTKMPADIDPKRSCTACHSGANAGLLNHENIYTADKVVVALPLGMLKNQNIVFDPVLPAEKLSAIDSLGIGTMNKVFLKFDQQFWNEEGYFFEYLKENHSKIIEFFSPTPTGANNVIVAVLAGQQARSIEKMEDTAVAHLVMEDLKGMFGNNIPQPTSMQKTAWHTNPFSLGSYPHLKPGADLSACDKIAKPLLNKLFFAGDASSSKYMATAHGAYLSGISAANSIMKL